MSFAKSIVMSQVCTVQFFLKSLELMFPLLYLLSVIGHHQRKYFPTVAHVGFNKVLNKELLYPLYI